MYDYHTDNDNSSIASSDDENSNTIPGLQERSRADSSSDGDSVYRQDHECDHTPATTYRGVPQSIDTRLIVHEWEDASMDEDEDEYEYDADHDDDDLSPQARVLIAPLRLQGGNGIPVVERVTEEDTEEGIEEQEQTQLAPKLMILTTTPRTQHPPEPAFDPMKDEPPSATITPSYVPL